MSIATARTKDEPQEALLGLSINCDVSRLVWCMIPPDDAKSHSKQFSRNHSRGLLLSRPSQRLSQHFVLAVRQVRVIICIVRILPILPRGLTVFAVHLRVLFGRDELHLVEGAKNKPRLCASQRRFPCCPPSCGENARRGALQPACGFEWRHQLGIDLLAARSDLDAEELTRLVNPTTLSMPLLQSRRDLLAFARGRQV